MNFNHYVDSCIPFKEKGRGYEGLDCWGLVALFYKEQMGIDLPDYLSVYENTKDKKIAETIIAEKSVKWESVDNPINGDVVLCRMRRRPMHVGVFQSPHYMLHIEDGQTPQTEKINGAKWEKRILGYYRLKK